MQWDALSAKGFGVIAQLAVAIIIVIADLADDDQPHAAGELAGHLFVRQPVALAAVADQDELHLRIGLEQPANRGAFVFGTAATHVPLSRTPIGQEHRALRKSAHPDELLQ